MTADRVTSVPPGARLDVDELLREGATITVTHDPGTPPDRSPEFSDPDAMAFVLATVVDPAGGEISYGTGRTAGEALALLHRRPTEPPIEYSPHTDTPFWPVSAPDEGGPV